MRKSWLQALALLIVLSPLAWCSGCSGGDEASSKSKEEIQKEYINRAERMQKENL